MKKKPLNQEEFDSKRQLNGWGKTELNRTFYPIVIHRINKKWKKMKDNYYYKKSDGDIIVWVEGWIDAYDTELILKEIQ